MLKATLVAIAAMTVSFSVSALTHVEINTNKGKIEIALDEQKAPLSTKNFIDYAKSGFYSNTIFHRVIPEFMIQGGGFTPAMVQKDTQPAIKNEAHNGLKNVRGSIAMARTGYIHSASSQFFINLKDNDFLDYRGSQPDLYGYAVFGHVTKGMNIVDEIAKVRTGNNGGHQNVPVDPVIIQDVKIKQTTVKKK